MSWGVPFSYEICTGCTVSIDPRLCVCILGVLPQDMQTVDANGANGGFWPNSQHLTLNPVTPTLTQGHHTKGS